MSQRVLASHEATESADAMRRVIEQGLVEQLDVLGRAAARLSDPNVWDGPHARQFRELWGAIGPRLEQSRADLADMRARIQAVTSEILVAGGAA